MTTDDLDKRQITSQHALLDDLHLLAQVHGLALVAHGDLDRAQYVQSMIRDYMNPWLGSFKGQGDDRFNVQRFHTHCRKRLKELAPKSANARAGVIARLAPLIARLQLDDGDCEFLVFSLAAQTNRALSDICSQIRFRAPIDGVRMTSKAMRIEPAKLALLYQGSSRLHRCGLISIPDYVSEFRDFLGVSQELFSAVFDKEDLLESLLSRVLTPAAHPKCKPDDFSYLSQDIVLMQAALTAGDNSAHVLVAGPPGIGKTEVARLICHAMGKRGFEVGCSGKEGAPATRDERFAQYSLASELYRRSADTLLIFDEAEDVFVGDHWTHIDHKKERHKGWTNQLLESSRVPTIWITNSIDCIDPAYLRRFDYVLKLRAPPRSVRKRLVESVASGLQIPPQIIERIADCEQFTPADANRVSRVLSRMKGSPEFLEEALLRLVSSRPGGVSRSALAAGRAATIRYRLDWLNVSADLPMLLARLKETGAGIMAFTGPPGTGKSALARYVADSMDRPLISKKASDLISPYIGETEKKIARAFEDALEDEAVLFLDEADSFVRDRATAVRSWEVSQVNEVLAQIDAFTGVAILASNFEGSLDRALMRRIDVKLRFDYLLPGHAWAAFKESLTAVGVTCPAEDSQVAQQVRAMQQISLGDLTSVVRGLRMTAQSPTADQFACSLQEEIRLKRGGSRPIGFASQ